MTSQFMSAALTLAAQARGHCHPNPMVGCVVVKNGQIVGEGWHRQAGTAHAEVHALKAAGAAANGATVYVTLEPCDHWGRTPPCTQALIQAQVAKVVIAMRDPNPVAQGGAETLRQAGIEVMVGDGAFEARILNERWITYVVQERPFVHVKLAMSLDAKVATCAGHSQWITGVESRRQGHRWRDDHEAILVGANTVLTDNPSLTCRLSGPDLPSTLPVRQPLRVVLAGKRTLPGNCKLLTDGAGSTLVFTTPDRYLLHRATIGVARNNNVELIPVPPLHGYPDPRAVLERLHTRGVVGVLVEGGPTVIGSFLDAGLVDRLSVFVAPKLLGPNGLPAFRHADAHSLTEAITLNPVERIPLGNDTLLTGLVKSSIQHQYVEEAPVVHRHC